MPRAGPSRSQRQPSQSQNQRYGRTRQRVEHEDEEEEEEVAVQNYFEDEEPATDGASADLKKRATDLVRLALFQEQKRMPLRRDEISKKVMGSGSQHRGTFRVVFEEAQNVLRATFGMELVELPTRAAAHDVPGGGGGATGKDKAREKAGTQNGEDEAGGRQTVTGLKKKAVSQGSKAYILRSTLDPVLIERAAMTDKRILEAEAAQAPDEVDGAEPGVRTYGCLIAWNSGDQLSALGILHIVLALILVSGKVISDMDLRILLRRLRLHPQTQLAVPVHSPHRSLNLDTYLFQLQRQGYLDRTRIGAGSGGTAQKRGRGRPGTQQGTAGGEDAGVMWEWRWGPRAMAEIGETAVARFVAEFMAERAGPAGRAPGDGGADGDASDEEGGGRRGRAHREEAQKRLAALLKGVERSAGGELAGVTV